MNESRPPFRSLDDALDLLGVGPVDWEGRLKFCQGELDAVREQRDEARAEVARLRAWMEYAYELRDDDDRVLALQLALDGGEWDVMRDIFVREAFKE